MELHVDGVSHWYGTGPGRVHVMDDVTLAVPPGEILCLIGPSGCGKSTLLRFLGGLERPSSGRVMQVGEPPENCLNPLTYVFQDFALLPWRTAAGNVSLVLEDHDLSTTVRRARVADVLGRTNLSEFADALPRQLSGGMRQRVAIARALAVSPAVMLMDEPLSALDSQTRELLLEDLVSLWVSQPFTAVYVTHNLAEAVRLGHRIAVLTRRPARVREVLEVGVPLDAREPGLPELRAIEQALWGLVRAEALSADKELQRV